MNYASWFRSKISFSFWFEPPFPSLSSFLLLFCVFAICHLEIPNSWYNKDSPCKQTSSLRRGDDTTERKKQKGQKVNLNREWTHKTVRLWEIDSSSDCWLKEIDICCCYLPNTINFSSFLLSLWLLATISGASGEKPSKILVCHLRLWFAGIWIVSNWAFSH